MFPSWISLLLCLFALILRCLAAAYGYMSTTIPKNVLPPVASDQMLHHCIEINPFYCLWYNQYVPITLFFLGYINHKLDKICFNNN